MIKSFSTRRRPLAVAFLSIASLISPAYRASAAFHLWQIKEVFSNADGSVQFVEMFDSSPNEIEIDDFALIFDSDGDSRAFIFPADIPLEKSTDDRHLLIATPGFSALPGGVTPDFILTDPIITGPFFNPNATNISISFTGSGDTFAFTGASLPKDGVNSLTDSNAFGDPELSIPNISAGLNSPTNIDNQSGSINLSTGPTGDYNGNHVVDAADYVNWRDRLNQTGLTPGTGPDGSNNGTVDLADYTFWRSRFGNAAGSGSSVPEPAALLAFGFVAYIAAARRYRR